MRRQQYGRHEPTLEDVTITIQDAADLKEESVNQAESASGAGAPGGAQTKSMHLLDAHIIFEPLLSSLGLMPQQIQNLSLKSLGYNVSVLGSFDQFKIDIIESEFGHSGHRRSKSARAAAAAAAADSDPSPAFLCEKIFLQADLKKVTDIMMSEKSGGGGGKDVHVPLYMTRAQLKRHTSSLINFSIDVQFISQKVNMPLLRLVNQIVTMHQNVKETNEELRELRPEYEYKSKDYMRHKKSSSGSSTSSNISAQIRQHQESLLGDSHRQSADSAAKRSMQTPSPSIALRSQLRSRPKSFAQKFRPNSRLAGYSNLESPVQEQHDSFILTSAPLEMITEEQTMIRCWKTMYNLLELYSTMPTTKTVQRQSLTPMTSSASADASGILLKGGKRASTPTTGAKSEGAATAAGPGATASAATVGAADTSKTPEVTDLPRVQTPGEVPKRTKEVSFAKADIIKPEHTPIIVFGIVRIAKTKLTATLSGLKLQGEIRGLQTSLHYREKIRAPMKGVVEASVLGNVEETTLVLLEGPVQQQQQRPSSSQQQQPQQQTVVKVTIGKSQVIHTSQMWKTKDKNSGTFAVELVHVEIPQHPVDLHGIVTRGTKELSSTLQEFRGVRILQRGKTVAVDDLDSTLSQSPKIQKKEPSSAESAAASAEEVEKSNLIKPFVMQFHIVIQKLLTSAALLPSLKAEYCMEKVTSRGVTGSKAKFVVDLPKHTLSFNTKLRQQDQQQDQSSGANLPSEASIDLPKVQVSAEYIQDDGKGGTAVASDGSILSQGSYLKAEAEIGQLEHFLTTDLLNHLVFVQKVFMREVNDVVQKMSGSDRPVPVWTEFGELEMRSANAAAESKRLLFSVAVRLRNITITATTPANSGVRFETGNSELHISNRVQNIKGSSKEKTKIFTKARVNIKLSLGQLIRHPIYFEAEPQFQQQAYFKTDIHLRNAFQGESVGSAAGSSGQAGAAAGEAESDAIFITLDRPLVFVMPVAVDRAILFWLSYKSAWEYWTEQRLNLNKEVLAATAQVLEKVPISQITSQLSAQHVGTLFLQLNVRDIGLCIPFSLDPSRFGTRQDAVENTMSAIVATVESSSISACSARSTVSQGKFKELCVRFTDDFDHFLDDWKPDHGDPNLINLCTVSEGSYEICSQTTKAVKDQENAKWLLHVQWQMTGVDVHVDTNIGKHLSALANTMTSLTGGGAGAEEEEEAQDENSVSVSDDDLELSSSDDLNMWKRQKNQQIDLDLPAFLFDPNLEKSVVAKYLEHEINEQAKTVEDLQKLGASDHTVASEQKKLNELQNIASKNFRADLAEKLRRQKTKASYFKEKFGLGPGGGTPSSSGGHTSRLLAAKSKSVCIPSPTAEEPEFLRDIRQKSAEDSSKFPVATDSEAEAIMASLPKQQHRLGTLSRDSTIDEEDEEVSLEMDSSQFSSSVTRQSTVSPRSNLMSSGANMGGGNAVPAKAVEPNVDFEFHVKIFINSGKCVLHTLKEEEKRKMKKDRSFSGNIFDSPNVSRKSYRCEE